METEDEVEYLGYYLIGVNVLSLAAFWVDKQLAISGGLRISEKSLLMLAALGGAVGAISGQRLFRHKTRKFKIVLPLVAIMQVFLVAAALWLIYPFEL
jgi:uncharacterized membrane protein YsdA (DUF1294 family)